MKRLTVFLVAAGLGLLTGCAKRQNVAQAAADQGMLLLGNGAEPQDLDPQVSTAYVDYNVEIALYEGLTCLDEASSEAVPGQAQSWDVAPDGLAYTFHLRPGLQWSNGDPVTAEDFRYSMERLLSPKLAAEYAYLLSSVRNADAFHDGKVTNFAQVGVKVADPQTLRIELQTPCPYLPAIMAHQALFPVHRATLEKFGAFDRRGTPWTRPENLIGNGPFLLKEWNPGSRIVVARNPRYWDDAKNHLSGVTFFPIDNPVVEENTYRAGQLHVTFDLQPDHLARLRREIPDQLRIDLLSESDFLRFNLQVKPLDDARVRQALSLAIDRVALCRDVLYGSRPPAFCLTPPGTGGYTSTARAKTDPAEARRLLAAAGFPGGKGFPKLTIQLWPDPIGPRAVEAIQQMWRRELGIDVGIAQQEFRVYLDNQRTLHYEITRARWLGDYNDPSTYLDMFLTGGGNNQTGWGSPEYDRLDGEANRTLDAGQRRGLLDRAEHVLIDQAPIAPLFFGSRTFLIQPYVKGWVPSLLGIHRYQYVRLER